MPRPIRGVLPIAHTPFTADDAIDDESLQRQIDWAFAQGADGFCLAMVSELLRLTSSERVWMTKRLVELNAGRGVVVISVGAESTNQALFYADQAAEAGADAVMAIPPISSPLPDDELFAYFATIAEQVEMPLIVQDASGYVGQSIPISMQVRLVERFGADKILFKPEAAPIGPNLTALRDATSGRARIFEGSGGIYLVDSFRRGVIGTMPGMELLDGIVRLWRALEAGDEDAIYRLYLPICGLVALQMQAGLDGFLAVEKYIMVNRGIFANDYRRRPNAFQLDPETAAEIDRLLDRLQAAIDSAA
ncbi:MAG: dihydrodipicolinate synthase family protein [Pirellulales bacterium]